MRLIDADALKEHKFTTQCANGVEIYDVDVVPVAVIDNAPTIEPFEKIGAICNENCGGYRPKGKWIIHNDHNENCRYGCDQCGNLTNRNSSFCPDCGARMESDV